ncbi:MAG TPA: EthD domain-containing protein [Xanthobacteraceae bacterium]|nr:EthD domain-containing protein [Xanthobacteraceae bacterium]
MIKTVSLLVRKDGWSHADFVRHWREIHGPLAYACPGVARYVQTEVKSSSFRTDGVAGLDVAVDGIAELWFEDQAALDAFNASPATRRLREDGAQFIGRQISFLTEETVIIPRGG